MKKQRVFGTGVAMLVLFVTLTMLAGCMTWFEDGGTPMKAGEPQGGAVASSAKESAIVPATGIPQSASDPVTLQTAPMESSSAMKQAPLVSLDLELVKDNRYALVYGNSRYTGMPSLANPVNDANDIAGLLEKLGFTVTLVTDASLGTMDSTLRSFAAEIGKKDAAIALFFYAGHGAQFEGVNYLLPVDADIQQAHELSSKALSMELVASTLERTGSDLNLVILDACRDNPFSSSRGSADRGLSAMVRGGNESMVVFATAPGAVAQDGTGRNSPFTTAFKEHLATPDLEIRQLVGGYHEACRDDGVKADTVGEHVVHGEFFFLTTEQLLANNRLIAQNIQKELSALEAEISQRQQAIDAETDMVRRQALELEQQRAEALEEAKSLEASRLAEIRKQAELSLSASKDELARKQAMEAGMLEQQGALAKVAEQKRKEIEQLEQQKMGLNNLQSRLELIASMEQAEADIKDQYARTIETLRQELGRAKEANIASYKEINPRDPWESATEFEARLSGYATKLDSEHATRIRELETERDAKVRSIGLEGAKSAIQNDQFVLAAGVGVLGFDSDTKEFEFWVRSKDPFVPLTATMKYQIAGNTREELQTAYTRVDNAQKVNALTAEIECMVKEVYPGIWRADTTSVVVKTLLEGTSASPGVINKKNRSAAITSSYVPYVIEKGLLTRVFGVLPIGSVNGVMSVYKDGMLLGYADATTTVMVVAKTIQESTGTGMRFEIVSTRMTSTESVEIDAGINDMYIPRNFIYRIGELGPTEGYIFYDKGSYSSGWRYLEAAPVSYEFNYKEWGGFSTSVGTGTIIGTGERNTENIVGKFGNAEPYGKISNYAAKVCSDLVVTKDGVVYDDWFLPSKDELSLMYTNLHEKGLGGFSGDDYWSSSEDDASYAWGQDFSDGYQNPHIRFIGDRVRPVRAF